MTGEYTLSGIRLRGVCGVLLVPLGDVYSGMEMRLGRQDVSLKGLITLELWQLRQKQALPLDAKIEMSKRRIIEWYENWEGLVYVAFSGGKDSTVLLHLVRSIYPEVPAVFVDTGLEFPEIREFVQTIGNVVWLKPQMAFKTVIETYGWPLVSKKVARMVRYCQYPNEKRKASVNLYLTGIKQDGTVSKNFKMAEKWKFLINAPFKVSEQCCNVMKKNPLHRYSSATKRMPYIGIMASDSMHRASLYLRAGSCNLYTGNNIASKPLSAWFEKDVWDYLKTRNVPYSTIYDLGYPRTGCIFCAFGAHLEQSPNRFVRMKATHPKLWHYCMYQLGMAEVLDYLGLDWGKQMTLDDVSNNALAKEGERSAN